MRIGASLARGWAPGSAARGLKTGGTDLHLKRLTWDAIESRTPATVERLAQELAVPVNSVCQWLDGESKPGDEQILAMIKISRAPAATSAGSAGASGKANGRAGNDDQAPG